MSHFVLKIIAMITMFFDHFGYALFGHFSAFNYIGRIAFPIFAFGISEGYSHTKSKKNYCMRLFLFALVSQLPFTWFNSIFRTDFSLNIFFTLLLGLIAIIGYEQCKNKGIGWILVVSIALSADFFKTDYGSFGIFMIFLFHIFKDTRWLMNLAYITLCLAKYLPLILTTGLYLEYGLLFTGMMIPLILLQCYNGKKGTDMKYLLYSFYPLHLILLYLFHILCIR